MHNKRTEGNLLRLEQTLPEALSISFQLSIFKDYLTKLRLQAHWVR